MTTDAEEEAFREELRVAPARGWTLRREDHLDVPPVGGGDDDDDEDDDEKGGGGGGGGAGAREGVVTE